MLDADQVSRDVVQPGSPALRKIVDQFGDEFLNETGSLDRGKMRELVFSEPSARQKLEAIVLPEIRQSMRLWTEQQTTAYCILAIPTLVEQGMSSLVQRVLVVDVSRATQKARLIARDGSSESIAEGILNAQASREERLAVADDVISNSAEESELNTAVIELHKQYLAWSQQG